MIDSRPVRVRFAPSPTGALHIGGVRTALFNYLFAKKHGGTFILRIEDTDVKRFVPQAEQYIIESLRWLDIFPDEGVTQEGSIVIESNAEHSCAPYRQSCRKEIYKQYVDKLIENGWAYYAFDTPDQIEQKRVDYTAENKIFSYNHTTRQTLCNSLTLSQVKTQELLQTCSDWVIRFKIPAHQEMVLSDLIRGEIKVNTDTLDDKVLWKKADELPTYHLANIVDDYLMNISHVIRGEEWLPSLPLHILLYEAFGWREQCPQFAHLPLILKPEGNGKLSKRDGERLGFPVFPLLWKSENEVIKGFKEEGYLPEALLNFLALLGWNSGSEQEMFTKSELITAFSIDKIVKSGAKFNIEKAKWFNQQYIKQKSDNELVIILTQQLLEHGIETTSVSKEKVIALLRERFVLLNDIFTMSKFFFQPPQFGSADKTYAKTLNTPETLLLFQDFISNAVELSSNVDVETLKHNIQTWLQARNTKPVLLMKPLRFAVVGEFAGPDMFEIIHLLGGNEIIQRLQSFTDFIQISDAE